MFLWTGCLAGWLIFLTRSEVDIRKWADCKLFYFLFHFGRHYSSMLLVLMSVEKCFAVYFPLKAKTVCTVKTAKWATGIACVIIAGYDSLYLIVTEISKSGNCIYVITYYQYIVFNNVHSVLYSFGPFAIMFMTNFAIVLKFMRAKCESNQNNSLQSSQSTNQALIKSATRGTAMVVTVSVTFIILTAPTALSTVVMHSFILENVSLYRAFMNITQYLNHSINGVLYCIVGSKFRSELLNLFNRIERCENISMSVCRK